MADELTPSFGNFSIDNTIEMGYGSKSLLDTIFAPETSTANPDEIKGIDEEASVVVPKVKPPIAQKIDKVPEIKVPEKSLSDQLLEDEDEEIEEVAIPKSIKKSDKKPIIEEDVDNDEDTPTNTYEALATDLAKLGVFSTEEGEELNIKTPEEFLERFKQEGKKEASKMVDDFIGQFGEDYQKAFTAIYVNGVDPKNYFETYNNIDNFTNLDLSKESNQEAVIRQTLTDQGFEIEDIETEVEKLKSYGDLESAAQRHHKVLIKKEASKLDQLEQDSQKRIQQNQQVKQQYIKNVQAVLQDKIKDKEFDGIPINPKLAIELQDFLITDKYKTPSGETLTEFDKTILELKRPENHQKKVKLALLLKVMEKDPNLSTIQKAGVTKETQEIFSSVLKQQKKKNTSELPKVTWNL